MFKVLTTTIAFLAMGAEQQQTLFKPGIYLVECPGTMPPTRRWPPPALPKMCP